MVVSSLLAMAVLGAAREGGLPPVWPGKNWDRRPAAAVGLDPARLAEFSRYVGGRGCVVRHGYLVYTWGDFRRRGDVASAAKPVYSYFLFKALEDGRIAGLDEPVVKYEPRLGKINARLGYKDRRITWRHLANQTSCYGLVEAPGTAFCYNDWQMALFWDILFGKVYGATPANVDSKVLHPLLTAPIQCADQPTFLAFGPRDRAGRLAISPRDFARFGLLFLRGGRWRDRQLLSPEHVCLAVTSPLPARLPRAGMQAAEMIPGQRSIGSRRIPDNQTDHFGSYSWLWWINGLDRHGRRHWPEAPLDTYAALGHGGRRALVVIPSLDLVVSWNDAQITNPAMEDQALARIRAAAAGAGPGSKAATVSIRNGDWYIDDRITYPGTPAQGLLLNVRMVNAVFEDARNPDFDPERNTAEFLARVPEYVEHGVRAFTINLQGGYPGFEGAVCSAFAPDGSLRPEPLRRVRRVIETCAARGAVVILGCYYQRQDQILRDAAAVRAGVRNVAAWLARGGWKNVVLEIANEYGHPGFDHPLLRTPAGQVELIHLAKRTAPGLLVSTSGCGDGVVAPAVARAADFILVHFNQTPISRVPEKIAVDARYGKPVVCNEDEKIGPEGVRVLELCVKHHVSWGLMELARNQEFPFCFQGAADDPEVYAAMRRLTTTRPEKR